MYYYCIDNSSKEISQDISDISLLCYVIAITYKYNIIIYMFMCYTE